MRALVDLYGTDEPPAPARRLRAGALEAELVGGQLRTIRFEGHEILRAVAYVVRDRDWGTHDLGIDAPAVEEDERGFRVSWRSVCRAPDGALLRLDARIAGESDGRLAFEVDARADAPFETNRCGFCVLHPIEGVAGRPVEVTHSDGSVERSRFPDLVEPWQPFRDIAAIAHEAAPGLRVRCRMEGDVFEMEDQRAWTDASYKTYVRPLALPWPYRLPAGESVRQRVAVEVTGAGGARHLSFSGDGEIALALGEATCEAFPRFGLLVSPEDVPALLAAPERLRELAPCHLLLHFDPEAGHGAASLAALALVRDLLPETAAILECVVPGRGRPMDELNEAARLVAEAGLRLDAVTVGPSADRQSTPPGSAWPPCPLLEEVYEAARRAFPALRLGGGMFSYFTELNRKRPPVDRLDYVTHATCPIVHAADDLSVMQTLEALPFVTRSARAIIGPRTPYHLGPTTIGMRQNPYGSRTMPNPENRRVAMAAADPRGRGLFAAAWLVGMAARLGGSGIEAWTGGSAAGPRGLLRDDGGWVPAFHVAADMAALSGSAIVELRSDDRSRVDGLAVAARDGRRLLRFANLTPDPQRVRLPVAEAWETQMLWAGSEEPEALGTRDRLELPPYAVVLATSSPACAP